MVSVQSFICREANKQDVCTSAMDWLEQTGLGNMPLLPIMNGEAIVCPICLLLLKEFGYFANPLKARPRYAVEGQK